MSRTFEIVRIFALKDLRVALTYKLSFVLGIFATFYGLIGLFFISRVVSPGGKVGSPEEYFRFIVVGVALANVLRASVTTAATNARREQLEGTLEILATQPVPLFALALGWSALPVLEALLDGLITILVAIPLGFTGLSPDPLSLLLVGVLSVVVFLAIGFVGAALVLAIQQGAGIMSVVVAGMVLVSGVAFPVSVLPASLRALSEISPLTYAIEALRGALLEGKNPTQLAGSLGVLALFAVVLAPLSLLVLTSCFRYARTRGVLARF